MLLRVFVDRGGQVFLFFSCSGFRFLKKLATHLQHHTALLCIATGVWEASAFYIWEGVRAVCTPKQSQAWIMDVSSFFFFGSASGREHSERCAGASGEKCMAWHGCESYLAFRSGVRGIIQNDGNEKKDDTKPIPTHTMLFFSICD